MESYGTDLAYIHDEGFSDFSLNAAPGLLAMLRRNGFDRGLVVDLGCGSGIWARQLGFAGYEVLGVDASPAMIRLARKRAPKAKFVTASLLDAELPQCAAVTAIGECLSYALHGDDSGRELDRLLRRVYRALLPGGIFVFDFVKRSPQSGGVPRKRYSVGRDWAVLLDVSQSEDGILTRQITSFRKTGLCYRRTEEMHRLRIFEHGEIEAALKRAGFAAEPLRAFGALRFRSWHGGMLARKAPEQFSC
jgi:SAM-dependent methyltransferase